MILEILLIAGALGLIAYVLIKVHQLKIGKEFKQKSIALFNQYGIYYKDQKIEYFKTNEKTYQVLFFSLHHNHELTVNSKIMWEVKGQGKPILINQSEFLKLDKEKIVIVFPSTSKIKRFINENELEFVSYNQMFYKMYLVRFMELEILLKEIN